MIVGLQIKKFKDGCDLQGVKAVFESFSLTSYQISQNVTDGVETKDINELQVVFQFFDAAGNQIDRRVLSCQNPWLFDRSFAQGHDDTVQWVYENAKLLFSEFVDIKGISE